jgi:hypothetical protein
MSPDWSANPSPVPYAKLYDPQTLNLYAYVGNNPLARVDLDGHCWFGRWGKDCKPKEPGTPDPANARNPNSALSPESTAANWNYKMVVKKDSGGKKDDLLKKSDRNGREITYVLQDSKGRNVAGPGVNVVISEHLSKPIGSGRANNSDDGTSPLGAPGTFPDGIGPGFANLIGGQRGGVSATRYFTATENGQELGVIPIQDRNGLHIADNIEINYNNNTTKLNGTYEPTNVE